VTLSWINAQSGRIEGDAFDHVVLACHGDEVLPLLSKHGSQRLATPLSSTPTKSKSSGGFVKASRNGQYVSEEEMEIFSAFQTTENTCYLHSDLSLMPKRRDVWTSWNYLIDSKPSKMAHPAGVSLTYCMNILQHLPEDEYGPVLVTMNPGQPPRPELVQGKYTYTHPLYTTESVRAQERLEAVQNLRGVSYCGAWTKYGFHEDGFSSGLRVAMEHLNAKLPFEFVDSTFSRGHKPDLCWKDYLVRVVLLVIFLWLRLLDRAVQLPVVAPVLDVVGVYGSRLLDLGEYVGLL
jgi:predicted NAD/FAD-binding protein